MRPELVGMPDPYNVGLLDMGLLSAVSDMMQTGMLIDTSRVAKFGNKVKDLKFEVESKILKEIGEARYYHPKWTKGVFNPGSNDQVADLLYNDLGVPTKGVKKTKSGAFKTDKGQLEKIKEEHPVIPLLLQHSSLSKMISAFVEPLPRMIGSDGRLRPTIKVTRTETGRLACAKPNLQQIPVRLEFGDDKIPLGKEFRKCFIPADGCMLVSVDQSQIEMRWMAHESGDPLLSECFQTGGDIHMNVAVSYMGKPADQITKMERGLAKNVGFGVLYGITAPGLLEQILSRVPVSEHHKWNVEECERFIEEWYANYPLVLEQQKQYRTTALRYGYIWCAWGRIRMTPGVRSRHPHIIQKTLREVVNMPIQSGAGGACKLGIIDSYPTLCAIREQGVTCNPLMQIHDELLMEVREDIAIDVGNIVREKFCSGIKLDVPIESDVEVGYDWGDMWEVDRNGNKKEG